MAEVEATGRVLVVDDELTIARAYTRTLTHAGYAVVTATDGVMAMEVVEQGGFDVVLTDVWMPGISGLDLLRRIRLRDPRAQIVVLSGAAKDEDAERAAEEGALMYLGKPVELRMLLQIVSYACRLRRVIARRAGEGG